MRTDKPIVKADPVAASLSWLKGVVSDERFSIAMAAVKKRRRYNPMDMQPDEHRQLFLAGYAAGFDDHLQQMIEASGQSSETFDSTQILEQVTSRTEVY